MTNFESHDTKKPDQAADIAFKTELPKAKLLSSSEPYYPFNEVANAWGAKRLYRGSEDAIHELVCENLTRISQQPGFSSFRVGWRGDSVVQINSFFPNFIVPVQVWKAGGEWFTSGNRDFFASDRLSSDQRIKMETTEEDESDQRRRIEALQRAGVRLVHSLCGGSFAIGDCEIGRIRDTSVIFKCPKCRIQVLHSLK